MRDDEDFRPRIGRPRDRGGGPRLFVGQALSASRRAGLGAVARGTPRRAAAIARRGDRGRRVIVKVRVVRHAGARFRAAPLAEHLAYLQRDGAGRDGERAPVFDSAGPVNPEDFAARCDGDRHHFRLIVSPEDAADMEDLPAFGRDLMRQAEADLGCRLDWVAVQHWNTAHPHLHILIRGVDDRGRDLVIPGHYLGHGLRARAEALVQLELGPRTAPEIAARLEQDMGAERWTGLDRTVLALTRDNVLDLRACPGRGLQAALTGRVGALAVWGLAEPAARGRWRIDPELRRRLDALKARAEAMARLHAVAPERPLAELCPDGPPPGAPVLGRVVGRGIADELSEAGFMIVDGADGRLHHLRAPEAGMLGDTPVGGLVEVRAGRRGPEVRHRSDLGLTAQVEAVGATWLDRQLVSDRPEPLAPHGFGSEAAAAIAARREILVARGQARQAGNQVICAPGLLETLRRTELAAAGARLAAESGLNYRTQPTPVVAGRYLQRVDLASGRYAMIEDGGGFRLTRWAGVLDRRLGEVVLGVVTNGRVQWDLRRGRELRR